MYYLIFSRYQNVKRTDKLQDVIFESNNPDTISAMVKFFNYIQYKQYTLVQNIDNFVKITSIFYSDSRDSLEIRQQFSELNALLENPETNLITKNEVRRLLKFLGFIISILAITSNYYRLQIISTEGNLSID